jgi:hypothetical protein
MIWGKVYGIQNVPHPRTQHFFEIFLVPENISRFKVGVLIEMRAGKHTSMCLSEND